MAVGVSFAAARREFTNATLATGNDIMENEKAWEAFKNARNLAIGIGIQNFPEGIAVSLPLKACGYSNLRAFWYVDRNKQLVQIV